MEDTPIELSTSRVVVVVLLGLLTITVPADHRADCDDSVSFGIWEILQ